MRVESGLSYNLKPELKNGLEAGLKQSPEHKHNDFTSVPLEDTMEDTAQLLEDTVENTVQLLEDTVPAEVFKAEVRAWARRIGVEPKEIHLRPMKRKIASCSAKGRLTFDTSLLKRPAAFRAEVIVHELVHLKVPNHGPLFRSLVRSYLARYRVTGRLRPMRKG